MTQSEAIQYSRALKRLASLKSLTIYDWLALLEDKLRIALPDNSQLMAEFVKFKGDAEQELEKDPSAEFQIRARCGAFIDAVNEGLESGILPQEDLKEEIDRIIQNGYFKSPYFRFIVLGFGVLLSLITGYASFKVVTQVQEMQRLLDKTKDQMALNSAEIAKMMNDTKSRQADLALLILQNNADMVKLQTSAMTQMTTSVEAFRGNTKRLTAEVEGIVPGAKQAVKDASDNGVQDVKGATGAALKQVDATLLESKNALSERLNLTLMKLEATEHPWVPRVLWSFRRLWLMLPLALIFAVLGLANSYSVFVHQGTKGRIVLAIGNAVLLLVFVIFVFRL